MLTLPPALQKLCERNRISVDLPAELFVERVLDALRTECLQTAVVAKSAFDVVASQSRVCPNPGIVRAEKVAAFDAATAPQSPPDNSCFDSAFPWLMGD